MVTHPQGLCQGLLCASERGGAAVLGPSPLHPAPPAPHTPSPRTPRTPRTPHSAGLETRWPEAAPGPAAWGCGHCSATGGQAHSPPCRGAHTDPVCPAGGDAGRCWVCWASQHSGPVPPRQPFPWQLHPSMPPGSWSGPSQPAREQLALEAAQGACPRGLGRRTWAGPYPLRGFACCCRNL